MEELGHSKIDLLKMDIEGSEYEVIQNILDERLEITQILIEFHRRFKEISLDESKRAISSLKKSGYKLFNISDSKEEYSFIKT